MDIRLPQYINDVIDRLESCGYEAYAVGGCVRDMLLGITPHDYDVCTSAPPDETERVFAGMRVVPTGKKHGTVTLISDQPVEITTYRTDGEYSDGRHPDSVTFVSDIAGDLARRDFTVNAMAYSERRGLVDLYGGREDLASGIIRCVGDPVKRFSEDALRILRALRFSSTYGFDIDGDTSRAIHGMKESLSLVSVERIYEETTKLLLGKNTAKILGEYADVVGVYIPEIKPMIGFDQRTFHHHLDVWEHTLCVIGNSRPDKILRWAALFHDSAKPACFTVDERGGHFFGHPAAGAEIAKTVLTRLHSDGDTIRSVCTLIKNHDNYFSGGRVEMRKYISGMGGELARLVLEFRVYDSMAQSPETRREKLDALKRARELYDLVISEGDCTSLPSLAVNGNDLTAHGIDEGKRVKEALMYLLNAVMEDRCANAREELLEYLDANFN